MPETQVSFQVENQNLRGMLHSPANSAPAPGVLFLHGFGGNRIGHQGLFVEASRLLALAGIASLRFDFRGCGESDGNHAELTLHSQVQDARAALAFLRSQPNIQASRLALIGFSLGAAVASQLADEAGLAALVLWSPVVFAVPIFARMGLYAAHPEIARHGWIDAGGFKVGGKFLAELPALDPLSALASWERPLYVLYGKEDTQVTPENAEALLSEVPSAQGASLQQGTHTFSTVGARHWLLEHTLQFLNAELVGLGVS